MNAYTAGVTQVNGGLQQMDSKSGQLKTGASELNTGVGKMTEKLPELFHGMADLKTGNLVSGRNRSA